MVFRKTRVYITLIRKSYSNLSLYNDKKKWSHDTCAYRYLGQLTQPNPNSHLIPINPKPFGHKCWVCTSVVQQSKTSII